MSTIGSLLSVRLWRRWERLTGPPGSLRAKMVHGVLGSGGIGVVSRLLQLVIAILLARILGAEGYGVYAYATSIVLLLAVPSQFGLPQLIVREVAANQAMTYWGYIRGLLRRAMQATVLLNVVIVAAAALAGPALAARIEALEWPTFAWALALIPLVSLAALRGSTLRGLHHIISGQLPEGLILPTVFVLLIITVAWLGVPMLPHHAMVLSVTSAAVAFVVGTCLLWRVLPNEVRSAKPQYETARWIISAVPFGLLAGINLFNQHTDIIMLGLFTTEASDVGVYRVVTQGATLILFSLITVKMALLPNIASLYASNDTQPLQRLITTSTRVALLFALPIAIVLIVLGEPLLGFVFGEEYTTGSLALAILCVGQLTNVAFGSVGDILNMTGHERDTLIGVSIGAVTNVVLNFLLIPIWGMEGAAVASVASLLSWNVYLAYILYRRTGLSSMAIIIH